VRAAGRRPSRTRWQVADLGDDLDPAADVLVADLVRELGVVGADVVADAGGDFVVVGSGDVAANSDLVRSGSCSCPQSTGVRLRPGSAPLRRSWPPSSPSWSHWGCSIASAARASRSLSRIPEHPPPRERGLEDRHVRGQRLRSRLRHGASVEPGLRSPRGRVLRQPRHRDPIARGTARLRRLGDDTRARVERAAVANNIPVQSSRHREPPRTERRAG